MLWPIVLPFQITFCVFVALIVTLTAVAPGRGWKRSKAFLLTMLFTIFAFIPTCIGVMWIVDSVRFGDFHYDGFSDIPDLRSKRYLPAAATNIQMQKHANGYRARYEISNTEFQSFLDNLWTEYGEYSAEKRREISEEGKNVTHEIFDDLFNDLGWDCPTNAIKYDSPRERDGGGATYYFDAAAGVAFQRTGFW